MKFKNKLFIYTIFLFFVIISSGIVFAEDSALPQVDNGEVSGGVDISSVNPFTQTNGELNYVIPDNVSEIKSVNVVVSSYSGSGAPTYGLTTDISLKINNETEVLEYANLTYPDSTASNPVVYPITNNTSKQYSDYQSLFDITDKVKGLSRGDSITISVNNTQLDGYSFDGRIKLIALIFAYDDNDNDKITYWLNIGQAWTKETLTTIFNTKDFDDEYDDVTLETIALSTADATYTLNGELLLEPTQEKGSYYIYDVWNITDKFQASINTNLTYTSSKASTYASYKAAVQLLKITTLEKYSISGTIAPSYANTVFAGVNNTLTIKVNNGNRDFKGSVVLLADGEEVAFSDLVICANNETTLTLIDPTIRPIDETTVNGADNKIVNYTLNILDEENNILNTTNASYKVLYNGNLGKDFAYPASNATVNRVYEITGDVVILTQDVSAYAGTAVTNRGSIFDVAESDVYEALLYVAYNWDKIASGDFNNWNITFNDVAIAPVASYRDQSNLGNYGRYGYGLIVYNVTDLVETGNNTLVINKTSGGCAVYPASLVLLTENETAETYKMVYIAENADLLSKQVNLESSSYIFMDVDTSDLINSTLYVFSASGQAGEGNIIVNDNIYEDIWNGTSSSSDYFMVDITDIVDDENVIYFQATGSTIVALQDIIVLEFEKKFELIAPDVEKYFNGPERFYAYLFDSQGNPVNNATITIEINGVTYSKQTDENGTCSIALGLPSGVYNVTTSYGNESVDSVVTILSTVNGTDVVKVFRNATQYYATFLDSEGNYLADGSAVRFNINGVMYDRKINGSEGLARLNINLEAGDYIITATNLQTGEMSSNNITVISRLIENKNITKYFKNATQYTVKVLGDDGNPVGAGENVTFNINGVFYTRQTNESGIAKLNINLESNNYTITAEFKDCKVSNNIEVLPVLSASDLTKKYGTPNQFVATLLDGQGKAYPSQNITFNVNGVFYNRVTDGEGQAKLNINLIPGEYIITSSYNGCNIANQVKVNT